MSRAILRTATNSSFSKTRHKERCLTESILSGGGPTLSTCAVHQSRQLFEALRTCRSPRPSRGDLGAQFVEDCLAERAEILRHHHKGSRATDHVVAVIGIKATRRIGVEVLLFAHDDETVDGDPFGKRLVARFSDSAAGILDAVAGYVDGVAVGLEGRAGKLRYGEVYAALALALNPVWHPGQSAATRATFAGFSRLR
jgi:hypothetical protein